MQRLIFTFLSLIGLTAFSACAAEKMKPAANLSAADIPVRITKAEVGEWAEYVHADGSTSRLTVMERWPDLNDHNVLIQTESFPANRSRKKKKRTLISEEQVSTLLSAKDIRNLGPNDFLTEGEVLVKGRPVKVVVVNYCEDGKVVRQSFFSDKVPVYGLVRGVVIEGTKRTVVMRLQNFGNANDRNTVLHRDADTIIKTPARP